MTLMRMFLTPSGIVSLAVSERTESPLLQKPPRSPHGCLTHSESRFPTPYYTTAPLSSLTSYPSALHSTRRTSNQRDEYPLQSAVQNLQRSTQNPPRTTLKRKTEKTWERVTKVQARLPSKKSPKKSPWSLLALP